MNYEIQKNTTKYTNAIRALSYNDRKKALKSDEFLFDYTGDAAAWGNDYDVMYSDLMKERERLRELFKYELNIKVDKKNYEKINRELEKIQGRANARKKYITDIESTIINIEKHFDDLKLTKKYRIGTIAENVYTLPRAYSYSGEYTRFRIERGATAWYIKRIDRINCRVMSGGGYEEISIKWTDEAKKILSERYINKISVI